MQCSSQPSSLLTNLTFLRFHFTVETKKILTINKRAFLYFFVFLPSTNSTLRFTDKKNKGS